MIRLIAIDLDGTIFSDQKEISERTMETLRKAYEMGAYIVPATGRLPAGIPGELLEMPGVEYAITSNGAKIIHLPTGKELYARTMDKERAWEILKQFGKYDVLQEIYFRNRGYVPARQYEQVAKYHAVERMREYFLNSRSPIEDMEAFVAAQDAQVDKIQVLFSDMDELRRAWDDIRDYTDIEPVSSLSYNIEINAKGVNKGSALVELARILNIPIAQTMACGDGDNDIELVRQAGIGVAMENACPRVIEAADFVTKSNNEDGVAYAVEKFVIHGKD